MSPEQVLDYRREIEENQKQIWEMIMKSYQDIAAGKGRGCNEFLTNWRKGISMTEYKAITL